MNLLNQSPGGLNLQNAEFTSQKITWNSSAEICGLPLWLAARFRELPDARGNLRRIHTSDGIPAEFGSSPGPEAYALVAAADGTVTLHAETARGQLYGALTLLKLLRQEELCAGTVFDYPNCSRRILKLYLPAHDRIAEFKRLIAFAAEYKYNAVMLEIGGAMEYRRHPEINAGWVERCRIMNEYPGKTQELQNAFAWEKNSIHSENGGGGWLSQSVVRELIACCRQYEMEVIPEVPGLSHCDYLLTRHPELAERADDPYPDTYCPSNPAARQLYFEILEEVIEVFQPQRLNFGHDEFYVMSHCPRCRGKSGMLLYAQDVNAVAEFLAARGVQGMMWGEKLLNAYFKDGTPIGGSRKEPEHHHATIRECQEAIYPAIDLIHSRVEILHWYWSIDRKLEEEFLARGFPMIFGNFTGRMFPEWRRRSARALGIMISNWGLTEWDTLQRNGILFDLVYDSALLWNAKLDDGDDPALRQWTADELFEHSCRQIPPHRRLLIRHATDFERPFRYLFDGYFRRDEDYLLGSYQLEFRDGGRQNVPVYYGGNIGSETLTEERKIDPLADCYSYDLHETGISGGARIEFGASCSFLTAFALEQDREELCRITFLPAPLCAGCQVRFECIN